MDHSAKLWVTSLFAWLGNDLDFGLFTVRDLTRGISWLLGFPLAWSEAVLVKGFRDVGIAQLPWLAVVAARHPRPPCRGRRLALLAAACCLYLAVFGLWAIPCRRCRW